MMTLPRDPDDVRLIRLAAGKVEIVTDEIDAAYFDAAVACELPGPRDAKILYSPLHGVGRRP